MFLMIENAVGEGFRVLGLGMGIVVSVLMILMIVLYIFIPLFRKISGAGKKTAKEPDAPPISAPAAVEEDDECEIVAAITAAISAQTGKAPSSLRVVSFKRIK